MFNWLFKRADPGKVDKSGLPQHIAIIMDGNGRWAKRRGLPRSAGHKKGSERLKKIIRFCDKIGIKYVTVYAFSTENWKRPKSEVDTLMTLLLGYLRNAEKELAGDRVCINVIGDTKGLPEDIQKEIERVRKLTSGYTGLKLNIALNYGSRDEIINAVKQTAARVKQGTVNIEDINDQYFSNCLYTAGIPDPDLLIRTSGEQRISNYLLWQLAYTEFWFTDVLWPDFSEEHLMEAITEYQNRHRRFGGI